MKNLLIGLLLCQSYLLLAQENPVENFLSRCVLWGHLGPQFPLFKRTDGTDWQAVRGPGGTIGITLLAPKNQSVTAVYSGWERETPDLPRQAYQQSGGLFSPNRRLPGATMYEAYSFLLGYRHYPMGGRWLRLAAEAGPAYCLRTSPANAREVVGGLFSGIYYTYDSEETRFAALHLRGHIELTRFRHIGFALASSFWLSRQRPQSGLEFKLLFGNIRFRTFARSAK